MAEQSKDYLRGYAAGRKYEHRTQREHEARLQRMALAAAIAPNILQNPWERTGADGIRVRLNGVEGIAGTVADLVKAIEQKL